MASDVSILLQARRFCTIINMAMPESDYYLYIHDTDYYIILDTYIDILIFISTLSHWSS